MYQGNKLLLPINFGLDLKITDDSTIVKLLRSKTTDEVEKTVVL